MFNRDNLFGKSPRAAREQGGYGAPPPGYGAPPPPRDLPNDTPMGGYGDPRASYGSGLRGSPMNRAMPQRMAVGRQVPPGAGMVKQLQPAKVEDKNLANQYIYGNM
jgi:vesicle-fusing ATPase